MIEGMSDVRLMTLEPGHFHAALVQKEMYKGVAPTVHVYAPLGADLLAHLQRIAGFNGRADRPTLWQLEVHAGPDSMERLLRERPGNVVVLSGRNRGKIDCIRAAVDAGLHVLADKPWVIDAADLPTLRTALDAAEAKGLIAYDIMTERYEITSILQREFVNDSEIFGSAVAGTEKEPGVFMESVHYLSKTVAGATLRRPAWFFDVEQQGEGLTDVGTHLVDLVPWILFRNKVIDVGADLQMLSAHRWPTVLSLADFQKVTGEAAIPGFLAPVVDNDGLRYFCNSSVSYTLRGINVGLNVLWDYEAEPGAADTHLARFLGTRSTVEVRQGKAEKYRPELCVLPHTLSTEVRCAVEAKVESLQTRYPGVGVKVSDWGRKIHILIPDRYRVGHEAHFGEVTRQFLAYLSRPATFPKWEHPNMLAKYHVTTSGVGLARATAKGGEKR
jgi:predicted dehydrogenase